MSNMNRMCRALLIGSVFFALANAAKILVVFSFSAHSHFTLGFRIAKELADRGHDITFITAYPQKNPIKNLREISVAETRKDVDEKKKELYDMGKMTYLGQLEFVSNMGYDYTENVLKVKEVQKLLNSNEKFDLVFMEHFVNDAMAIFPYKLNCPYVLLAPGPTTVLNNYLFANPSQPSYVANFLAEFGSHMTFWERVKNLYYEIVGELYIHNVMLPKQEAVLKRTVPGAPDLNDILYNSSLLLLFSHISLKDPAPHQPTIKEIGGYHVWPTKPLPKDIQEFLDNAKEGVILFSMGSNLKSADFSQEKKDAVLRVFSRLKQKVIWKFEKDLPEKPENVKIMSWLPQQDILAHPNVILFITHVGLLGALEAVYYGVPMLGLPVFWDQEKNIADAIRKGFALKISFQELTEENFRWSLDELINNPKYRKNAKMWSNVMHDQPISQLDEAIYWLEYVIRHNGAAFLRSPALDLKWYQRYFVDVLLLLTLITLILSSVVFYILRKIFSNRNERGVKKTKKNN